MLPNELERRAEHGHDNRRFSMRRHDDGSGWVITEGELDVECGELLHTVLHASPGALPAVAGSGTTLPISLVRRWWCDSDLTRFVCSLGRKVIETSHTARTLKAHERRAKHLETGGRCQGAGCHRGPGCRLIAHHADPWAQSHTTSLADTVLLCEQTHHHLHAGHTHPAQRRPLARTRRLGPRTQWITGPGPVRTRGRCARTPPARWRHKAVRHAVELIGRVSGPPYRPSMPTSTGAPPRRQV